MQKMVSILLSEEYRLGYKSWIKNCWSRSKVKPQYEDCYLTQISEDTIVAVMIVGAIIVGAMIVGAMIVGAMIVGAMIVGAIVGAMIVGAMIVGAIWLPEQWLPEQWGRPPSRHKTRSMLI